ncbi:hypothetical protein GC177_02160 [bacterium]|nr:hypothetical protein [bacterium]
MPSPSQKTYNQYRESEATTANRTLLKAYVELLKSGVALNAENVDQIFDLMKESCEKQVAFLETRGQGKAPFQYKNVQEAKAQLSTLRADLEKLGQNPGAVEGVEFHRTMERYLLGMKDAIAAVANEKMGMSGYGALGLAGIATLGLFSGGIGTVLAGGIAATDALLTLASAGYAAARQGSKINFLHQMGSNEVGEALRLNLAIINDATREKASALMKKDEPIIEQATGEHTQTLFDTSTLLNK